ncbi:MAG: hypothetical protein KL863_21635 [Rhizobium sp.]|nr:hypothetical protein [Rhizobium sp.]
MLRSAFAVIAVACMIGIVFIAAFVISGASILGLVMSVIGFNAGLVTYALSLILSSGGSAP